ncbi:FAD-dependent oxidoreductase [Myxococcota bacterium]|nr:FAD-dependent oxidoreductase [Myxococcota bacterium]
MRRTAPLALLALVTACKDGGGDDTAVEVTRCEVAIVGGGVGGLYTAFRLAPTLGDAVCLFEREAALGGRIKDVSLDESDPNAPRVGVGARRVMEGQTILLDLADELSIPLEAAPGTADLVNARGEFAFSKEELVDQYALTPDPNGDTETALYDQLRFGPERANASSYADFGSYVEAVVGAEGYEFLRDMSRFRADFEYPLDAAGYLDYLDEEWDVCCEPSYPVGGMSRFIVGMQEQAEANGARIYTSETVTDISRAEGGYALTTSTTTVDADKVVIAIPPHALQWVTGDVVDDIRAQTAYQDIVGVKVVTITQWWPEDWYSQIVNPDATEGANVWRAWTTEHCLNFIEIPQEPYAAAGLVTRSVYNDNLDCSESWEALANQGEDAVEAAVKEGLEHLFNNNGVSSPATVTIPDPLKTTVQVWPDAWHWLGAGASVTNAELMEWAAAPLGDEDVALVGEAYNVQRSGWSDGAYKSSIHLLNTRYGLSL